MQTLGSVAVGSIVKIKENGSPVDFYVAKHDYESGLNGAGRTLLVRKDVYDNRSWDSDNVNAWARCTMRTWLNGAYKAMLDSDIQEAIGTTRYYYTPGNGSNSVTTRSDAIFMLSLRELGQSLPTGGANNEGSVLPIASTLRFARKDGEQTSQWTRTPRTLDTTTVCHINSVGNVGAIIALNELGSRPIFTLAATTTYVEDDGTIILNQPPTAPGTITVPSAGSKGGSLTVSWTASTDPDGNLSGYTLQRMVDNGSWEQVYQGANTSFTDTLPATASEVQYRVQAYDAAGATSDWTTSSSVPVYGSPKLTVPIQAMQGQQVNVSWTEIDGADSYILQRKANTDSDWTQVYAGTALTYSETAGTWTTVQYRVCAVFGSTNGEWATSGSVPVVSASALVISGADGDLGTLTHDVEYTVSSDGTNPITVEEDVNGTVRTFTAVNGGTNVIPVVDLPTGTGTITIKATTQATAGEVSVTRSWTYAKDAPVFSDAGSLAQLTQQGANIFPKTIAEAVRAPGLWGGNLGLALSKLAGSVLYNATQQPKYAEVKIDLSTAQVGDEINLPYNGVMVPHIVVHIGNPNPDLYDASCDGVWILRKDIVENGAWNSSGVNTLAGSTIMTTMAGYLQNYDSAVQAAIKTVKVPYTVGGESTTINSGANGLECQIFPLCAKEAGNIMCGPDNVPATGAVLDYFSPAGDTAEFDAKRVAYLDGVASRYYYRDASYDQQDPDAGLVFYCDQAGNVQRNFSHWEWGYRPVFIMQASFNETYLVDGAGAIHGQQEYLAAGGFYDVKYNAVPVCRIETGSYTGTGTYGSDNPTILTFGAVPMVVFIAQEGAGQIDISLGWLNGNLSGRSLIGDSLGEVSLSWEGNSISYYSADSSAAQFNHSGAEYKYLAIVLGGEPA